MVQIQAFADPTPPDLDALEKKPSQRQWEELCRALEEYSEQELMDQVYRKMTLYLCGRCFEDWYQNPTG